MRILGIIAGAVLIGVLVLVIQAWVLMLGWNFLAAYFGFQEISFLVSLVIVILLGLVGGFFKTTVKKD